MDQNIEPAETQYRIKLTRNGPIIVSGGVPLFEFFIRQDGDGYCHGWRQGKKYETAETYALCRCGRSKNKPFCDGSHHLPPEFDGPETASRTPFMEQAGKVIGPELTLAEVPPLCSESRFCQRAGGTWRLVAKSDDDFARRTAIEEAADCPSGRLVLLDKSGKEIEPVFAPSIGVVEDSPLGLSGPLWVRGGIPIESADGFTYETRNRVTLCRCGQSKNMPFCDGRHLEVKFKASE